MLFSILPYSDHKRPYLTKLNMKSKKIKRPRVKERILELWNRGMCVADIARLLHMDILYVANKLKYYGEIPKDLF